MFEVWFDGLRVVQTTACQRELVDLGLDLGEAVSVLQFGFECNRSKRQKDKLEKCLRKGDKIIRVVAAYDYSIFLKEDVITIIHVSKEGLKYDQER